MAKEIKKLIWKGPFKPNENVRYNNDIAETVFGNFLITWKSLKEHDSFVIEDTPWGNSFEFFSSLEKAKEFCQRKFEEKILSCFTDL